MNGKAFQQLGIAAQHAALAKISHQALACDFLKFIRTH